ncbi:hypothetical protein C0991_005548 [Blastosporella zonata]|nr:hypothetical protein C0991_005548 [Blastosporella zonata]
MSSLTTLPEELLERILLCALPSSPPTARPHWLRSPHSADNRLSPLLVSRKFNRIATPLLYHSVSLLTSISAALLLWTLEQRPELAGYIRELVTGGLWVPVRKLMTMCVGLKVLDLTILFDGDDVHEERDANPFARLAKVKHLTLRKPSNVYLSLARPRALIISLAAALSSWDQLRTVDVTFKLSDDTPTSPIAGPSFVPFAVPSVTSAPIITSGPITALANALASSSSLHTFSTQLPSVWNTAIATIASNPRLERIVLAPACSVPSYSSPLASYPKYSNWDSDIGQGYSNSIVTPALPGTGLFLMEARRHPRLAELIGAGTPIIRSRAHTLGTQRSPPPPSPSAGASATSTSPSKRESGVGLGLRIDTSSEAVAIPTSLGRRSRSPGASTPGSRSAVTAAAVNPAWMGPVRATGTGAGKRRTRV